jgi:superfamily II DNA or RNA helicase
MTEPTVLIPQDLRPYQLEAVTAIRGAWDAGDRAPLAALATGAGKTTIIAQTLVDAFDPSTQRALVIGHTQEIIGQLYDRIRQQFAGRLDGLFSTSASLFAPGIGIVMAEQDAGNARVVVATRQSLHAKRLAAILKHGAFDYLVIDESHHALGDNTYGDIVDACRKRNRHIRILGVTATPQRTDEKALKSIFSRIVYQWLIPDGIAGGYLTPVTRVKVATRVDLSRVKTRTGDYAQNQMVSVLDTANWRDLCVQAYMKHVAKTGRSCLAFLPSVDMSIEFAALLSANGVPAAHIDGNTPRDVRIHTLSEYAQGRILCVSNFGVLTEGFDAPRTSVIFLGRPTRSKTLFTQIVGRGLRPYPGKSDCLLLDMTVVDTKAIETGTLLGKMRSCAVCGADFFTGFRACPSCGAEVQKTPAERAVAALLGNDVENDRYGVDLSTVIEPLFAQAFGAWYWDEKGFMSCGLGFDRGTLFIVPPLVDEQYTLLHLPKPVDQPAKTLGSDGDVRALIDVADAYIRKTGAERTADKEGYWRSHPATPLQLSALRSLGAAPTPNLSKGAASQMISHLIGIKRVMKELGVEL